MSYHIKDWALEQGQGFEGYQIIDGKKHDKAILPNLSKINIFVGANNSGKSRLLRQLASQQQIFFNPHFDTPALSDGFSYLNDLRASFLQEYERLINNHGVNATTALRHLGDLKEPIGFVAESLNTRHLESQFKNMASDSDLRLTNVASNMRGSQDVILNNIKQLAVQYAKFASDHTKGMPDKYTFKKLYIPTLRGLRTFEEIQSRDTQNGDIYSQKTINDYFLPNPKAVTIFTGLTLYNEIHDLLTGTLSERRFVTNFENFIAKTFFNGKAVTLIPRREKILYVKIGGEEEFPIHQLGDGIQSIIILTFPIFRYADTFLLAFFEEPELYMHPSIQRIFLEVLNKFPNHQYFLTTHSNHFLDITLDLSSVSVFTFQKQLEKEDKEERRANFIVENVSNENRQPLELLGVRNSSVFLSNCTIWVEGITDRMYYSKYLELYQAALSLTVPKFREDLHYSFVEYGGSNITHWSFLDDGESKTIDVEKLCGKLFLITDKDGSSNPAKQERHKKLKEFLGDRYYCLESREVENLLTEKVIGAIVKSYEGDDVELNEFNLNAYKNELLGSYIEKHIIKNPPKRVGSYKTKSGTITDKPNFCHRAIAQMKSFESLSTEAKDITTRLYAFIESNNK